MKIFGVLNASPDSLADFSITTDAASARVRARALLDAGADYIDIGAEGSTQSAAEVDVAHEWERLVAPLTGVLSLSTSGDGNAATGDGRWQCGNAATGVAVDTRHAEVARRSLDLGATVLNAGDALQTEEMLEVVADSDVLIVLPFILGPDFRTMRRVTGNPIAVMLDWFDDQLRRLRPWGVVDRLLLDPGVGFAPPDWDWTSRFEYQKLIYTGLPQLRRFGLPLYVPVAWKQRPDRLELMDIALSHKPEFVRAHIPSQVLERDAALRAGSPLPHNQFTDAHI